MEQASIASGADQIIGRRAEQQDRFGQGPARLRTGESATVHVLADGMGGHSGGAIASARAVEAFLATAAGGDFSTWGELLDKAMLAGNRAIGEHVRAHPRLEGMGCTLLAAIPTGGQVHYISVGDSPFYRLRANGLERVNADHSMAPLIDRAAAAGDISHEEARDHPQRGALRSALVGSPVALVDMQTIETRAGEVMLLASDGILSIDEPQIAQTILEQARGGVGAIVAGLLAAVEARHLADQDNCTLVVMVEREAAATARSSQWPAWTLLGLGIAILALVGWVATGQYAGPGRDAGQQVEAGAPAVAGAGGTVREVPGGADVGNPRAPGRPYPAGVAPVANPAPALPPAPRVALPREPAVRIRNPAAVARPTTAAAAAGTPSSAPPPSRPDPIGDVIARTSGAPQDTLESASPRRGAAPGRNMQSENP